jgi:O-antigen/teichoic acid export membrane protein
LLRILLLFLLYYFLPPFAFYLAFTFLFANAYVIFFNIYYKNKFLPNLFLSLKYFDINSIIEVLKSGFWNVIIRLGQFLLDGFDLFISNWFLGPSLMGLLALSKSIPTTILSLIGFVVYAFIPDFTYLYAQNKINDFKYSIKRSIKILGLIINIPIALLFVYGRDFYKLWLPESDFESIYLLSSISLLTLVISGSLNPIYGVFTVTNRLKINSLAVIISGLIGFAFSLILLNIRLIV